MLEQDHTLEPGTAALCMEVMDVLGSEDRGWCVGDSQTSPKAGTFDDSPFSINRGFDIIVPRSTMSIEFSTSHGTPQGNENLDGDEILAAVQEVIDSL